MPWMPTAKPPIQSPSGSMKSARQKLARSRLLRICWRRKGMRTWRSSSVEVDHHVVALARARPEARDASGGQPLLGDDPLQHCQRIGVKRAGAFADDLVGQHRRVGSGEFPGAEERGPVEALDQIGQVPFGKHVQPGLLGRWRLVAHIGLEAVGAGIGQAEQNARILARADIADVLIFGRGRRHQWLALGVGKQLACHPDRAAGVEHVDHRAVIGRVDPQRGVDLAGGRPADQQRHGEPGAGHLFGDGDHLVQ